LAEKALKRTADYFYSNSDYDLAADVYAAYERSYPRSPLIPEVKLKHAFSNYAQFRGVRFDPTPMIDARTQLQEYIAQYPKLAQEQDIPALVERIDNTLARKMWVTADFYRRTGQPRAQLVTLRQLVQAYPNSPDADRSRTILARAGPAAPPPALLNASPTTAPAPIQFPAPSNPRLPQPTGG
jgi:outer membrane protein assembly factor BamD (BamD/ComL family)